MSNETCVINWAIHNIIAGRGCTIYRVQRSLHSTLFSAPITAGTAPLCLLGCHPEQRIKEKSSSERQLIEKSHKSTLSGISSSSMSGMMRFSSFENLACQMEYLCWFHLSCDRCVCVCVSRFHVCLRYHTSRYLSETKSMCLMSELVEPWALTGILKWDKECWLTVFDFQKANITLHTQPRKAQHNYKCKMTWIWFPLN
jgi:hypothetical protein